MVRAAAAVVVLVGWTVVIRGLFLGTPTSDPALDLDAGPAFATNLTVHLPAVALTLALLAALATAVAWRRGAPVGGVAAAGVVAFCLWVLRDRALLDRLPGLRGDLWVGLVAAVAGVVAFLGAALAAPPAPATALPEGPRVDGGRERGQLVDG